jgi:hypothetical protein
MRIEKCQKFVLKDPRIQEWKAFALMDSIHKGKE